MFFARKSLPVRSFFIAGTSALLSACATMSAGNLFSHYSAQTQEAYFAVRNGNYAEAQEKLNTEIAGPILDNMEKGRVSLLNQDYAQSMSYLKVSDNAVKVLNDRATISLSETANTVGALATNDNMTTYEPADYELGFLHLYLGLNYLQKNDLSGALVEMRRANQVQEQAKKRRQSELESAQVSAEREGVSPNIAAIMANYPDAGDKLKAVQNGYLLYLSSLLYETDKDLNSAYIDYKRALAVMPDNKEVIDAVLRVGHKLGMRQDLKTFEARYGKYKKPSKSKGRVIVLDEQRVVKAMDSFNYSLPVYNSKENLTSIYSIALPYYPNTETYPSPSLMLNGTALNRSELVDVNLMAQNNLSERMPGIIIRQALRVVAKDQLRREATKGDDVGNALFSIWNALTEQADTRSWQTLPAEVFSSSEQVNPGEHTLVVNGQNYTFNVKAGQTTLVWVSRQGTGSSVWHKQLGAI
ncbi:lipoprotein [Vibrio nigripulchritudo]|nr:lipoprotein [Vibrio nigripulchritudo]